MGARSKGKVGHGSRPQVWNPAARSSREVSQGVSQTNALVRWRAGRSNVYANNSPSASPDLRPHVLYIGRPPTKPNCAQFVDCIPGQQATMENACAYATTGALAVVALVFHRGCKLLVDLGRYGFRDWRI